MISLTTRQRDLVNLLLEANAPLVAADIAHQLQLTPRQVNYSLKRVRTWLAQRDVTLKMTPGVGVALEGSPDQIRHLSTALESQTGFRLVLTSGQRQQLFAHSLLAASEPVILCQLEQGTLVSRTTILKDLDAVEKWIQSFGATLERRPNYGFWLAASEWVQRQIWAALLWGDAPFDESLTAMTHAKGLVFSLSSDADLLPIVQQAHARLTQLDTRTALEHVAYAEHQIGGRFTDDAVLHLALAFAIQTQRVQAGRHLECEAATLAWLQSQAVWTASHAVAQRMWPRLSLTALDHEVAGIAMHLLTGTRNDRWPGDLEANAPFAELIASLMETIAQAYRIPELSQDSSLRDGLVAHLIPACMRRRFGLWTSPDSHTHSLSEQYAFEHTVAQELAAEVATQTGILLPPDEVNNLVLLLRAAFIRERPHRSRRVIVVCPSGMATAQLLVARLRARFPHLGTLEILSLRKLSPELIKSAQLIISTVPLPATVAGNRQVIQVHPLLLPEDIEKITAWLA